MLKIAYSPIYQLTLPEGHRFPMLKYELIPEQLLYEGSVTNDNFFAPKPLSEDIITATHTLLYFNKMKQLELTPKEMVKRGLYCHAERDGAKCAQGGCFHFFDARSE